MSEEILTLLEGLKLKLSYSSCIFFRFTYTKHYLLCQEPSESQEFSSSLLHCWGEPENIELFKSSLSEEESKISISKEIFSSPGDSFTELPVVDPLTKQRKKLVFNEDDEKIHLILFKHAFPLISSATEFDKVLEEHSNWRGLVKFYIVHLEAWNFNKKQFIERKAHDFIEEFLAPELNLRGVEYLKIGEKRYRSFAFIRYGKIAYIGKFDYKHILNYIKTLLEGRKITEKTTLNLQAIKSYQTYNKLLNKIKDKHQEMLDLYPQLSSISIRTAYNYSISSNMETLHQCYVSIDGEITEKYQPIIKSLASPMNKSIKIYNSNIKITQNLTVNRANNCSNCSVSIQNNVQYIHLVKGSYCKKCFENFDSSEMPSVYVIYQINPDSNNLNEIREPYKGQNFYRISILLINFVCAFCLKLITSDKKNKNNFFYLCGHCVNFKLCFECFNKFSIDENEDLVKIACKKGHFKSHVMIMVFKN